MNIDKLRSGFSGHIDIDEETLVSVSTDFGRLMTGIPSVVAVPSTALDVQHALNVANEEGWSVSTRGAAHSQGGQSLSQEGLLLDLVGLSDIGDPENETIWVGAGALWGDLLEALAPRKLIPPVLTNNLNVTVGGSVSFGGIGSASHSYGTQSDNVLALEVVTGAGDLVRCSETENSDLFNSVRCGLGQFGVITKVQLALRRALPNVRTFYLLYDDLHPLMNDLEMIAAKDRFDFVEGWCAPCTQGMKRLGETAVPFAEWFYPVHLTVEYDTAAPTDSILSSLHYYRLVHMEDSRLQDFLRRMEPVFQLWRESGAWNLHHPWMQVLLPWERAAEYIEGILKSLPPHLINEGQALLWVCSLERSRSPMFIRPEGEPVMGFGIQPAVSRNLAGMTMSLMQKASDLVMQVGGKRYLSGWLRFDHSRWKMHFGELWPQVVQWKKFFDPNGILNAGLIDFSND